MAATDGGLGDRVPLLRHRRRRRRLPRRRPSRTSGCWTSGHTEAIVTTSQAAARRFTQLVDSTTVAVNASTRFTDGGQFGFGAEIGISTQKLHARGPDGPSRADLARSTSSPATVTSGDRRRRADTRRAPGRARRSHYPAQSATPGLLWIRAGRRGGQAVPGRLGARRRPRRARTRTSPPWCSTRTSSGPPRSMSRPPSSACSPPRRRAPRPRPSRAGRRQRARGDDDRYDDGYGPDDGHGRRRPRAGRPRRRRRLLDGRYGAYGGACAPTAAAPAGTGPSPGCSPS